MLAQSLKKDNLKEWKDIIEKESNSFSFNGKKEAEAIAKTDLLSEIKELCFAWIKLFGEIIPRDCPYVVDGRNRVSAYKCKMLVEILKDDEEYCKLPEALENSEYKRNKAEAKPYMVAWDMLRMHRTLQQTFAGFVFSFLSLFVFTDEMNNKATELFGYEDWQRNPMI